MLPLDEKSEQRNALYSEECKKFLFGNTVETYIVSEMFQNMDGVKGKLGFRISCFFCLW